ncbi:alpha/beta fold hydrolase [Desulfosarcina sp.]|uniref:alpha/beta fold hydrolase n=1 Tax=Desulfosarcina sp. TaxID=2027861 RepID=UPI003970CB82
MPDILVNGVRLSYTEQGSGPETIIFSHSYLLDSRHFDPQIAALRGRYRCIAYDHRGHGRSEVARSGYEMENLYRDAVSFIEALGCAPCHFVGLSTGGFIGLRIAIRRPEMLKSLILMDTSADAEPPEARKQYRLMLVALRWLGYRPVVGRAMPIFLGPKFLQDPSRSHEVRQWRRRMMANDRQAMIDFANGIFSRESVFEQIDAIQTPTLVVVGEKDVPTPPEKARRMVEKISGAQLKVIPNAGHLSTVEEPAAVNAALVAFLDSQG